WQGCGVRLAAADGEPLPDEAAQRVVAIPAVAAAREVPIALGFDGSQQAELREPRIGIDDELGSVAQSAGGTCQRFEQSRPHGETIREPRRASVAQRQ